MKTKVLFIVLSFFWIGLKAQTVSIHIKESTGDCLLNSSCEDNTLCYDMILEINEPNWMLRSYNVWVQYPSPPLLNYNSDNSCLVQNGGDTDNDINGQYRVSGVNGSSLLLPNVPITFHSICFEYTDENLIVDSLIKVGGTALMFGYPFESAITLMNTVTGVSTGINLTSTESIPIRYNNNQNIEITGGWSGISAWLQPNQPDIEDMMSPVIDKLVVMYNLTDGIFYPSYNINTIINWNNKSGYITKVSEGASISFCGTESDDKSIDLMAGWNIIPVLSRNPIPVEQVFNDLGNNLVLVKAIAGYQLYYPVFSINTLNSLAPGKAYFVKVLQNCTITFPDESIADPSLKQEYYFQNTSPWNIVSETPESHIFCFDVSASSVFQTGDLIGAFDQNGLCSGLMEVLDADGSFAVPVFINDQTTDTKDGLNEGELISFRMWRPATGDEFNLVLSYREDSPSGGNFVSNGISFVKSASISSSGSLINNYLKGIDLSVYPNPTSGELNLKLTGDVRLAGKIVFTTVKGQILFKRELQHTGSISDRQFDLSAYKPGVYYLRVVSEDYYNIQKIIIE